jgi:hypothetical protein
MERGLPMAFSRKIDEHAFSRGLCYFTLAQFMWLNRSDRLLVLGNDEFIQWPTRD